MRISPGISFWEEKAQGMGLSQRTNLFPRKRVHALLISGPIFCGMVNGQGMVNDRQDHTSTRTLFKPNPVVMMPEDELETECHRSPPTVPVPNISL